MGRYNIYLYIGTRQLGSLTNAYNPQNCSWPLDIDGPYRILCMSYGVPTVVGCKDETRISVFQSLIVRKHIKQLNYYDLPLSACVYDIIYCRCVRMLSIKTEKLCGVFKEKWWLCCYPVINSSCRALHDTNGMTYKHIQAQASRIMFFSCIFVLELIPSKRYYRDGNTFSGHCRRGNGLGL